VFPNPQDALPLPKRPSLEQYRKLAKDLVRACVAGTIGAWADRWIAVLGSELVPPDHPRARQSMDRAAGQVEEFATRHLKDRGKLTEAQFVIARSHGFLSWPKFVEHLDRLAHLGTEVADFEAAADAIINGDEVTLRRLLSEHPGLVRMRSTREHNSTLLHYASANGVEGYRQRTPMNIVRMAQILLDAGAEIDAEADVYGGGATTLGLAATSAHPRIAGVQIPLLGLLIDRGARIEHPRAAGSESVAVMGALDNGCPEAAEYLASRGARLDLATAAGVGRLDVVRELVQSASSAEANTALRYAAFYGRLEVVRHLLERGADLGGHSGDGQTAAHYAGMGGQLEVMKLLLQHRPPLEARNEYGGTVLSQTLWSAAHGGDPDTYIAVIDELLKAGAHLEGKHPPVSEQIDAFLTRHGSIPEPGWYWFGEQPRRKAGGA